MRYSGEGTQENPYIPEDFTGFLHCIAQTDSYVKLESDIDAAADSGYEGILYEPVTFNCKECYADELKKIIGATVCANNAFYVGSSGSDNRKSVRNIGFIDWSFKQNGNTSNGAGNLFKIGDYFTLYGCSFSVQSAGQNRGLIYFSGTAAPSVSRCAFYVKYSESTTNGAISGSVKLDRCNFILDGGTVPMGSDFFGPGNSGASVLCTQVGVVIKNAVLKYDGSATKKAFGINANSAFNYLVFETSCTSEISGTITVENNNNQGLTLFVTNGIEKLTASERTTCHSITEAQLKDADYLTEIGFFP